MGSSADTAVDIESVVPLSLLLRHRALHQSPKGTSRSLDVVLAEYRRDYSDALSAAYLQTGLDSLLTRDAPYRNDRDVEPWGAADLFQAVHTQLSGHDLKRDRAQHEE